MLLPIPSSKHAVPVNQSSSFRSLPGNPFDLFARNTQSTKQNAETRHSDTLVQDIQRVQLQLLQIELRVPITPIDDTQPLLERPPKNFETP